MLVTVVTVVKNNKNLIARTLESILQQNYKNLELIVIDGNSGDGTDIIIKNYFKEFKFIKRNDQNVYDSINYACKIAKGDFICFLHSGDIYYDDNVISNFAKNSHKKDLISSSIIYFNENLDITRFWRVPSQSFTKNPHKFAHTGLFYSRKIYKNYFYDEKFKISSDSKFLFQISKKKIVHKNLNIISVCMFNRGLSTNMSSFFLRINEDLTYLKECYKEKYLFYYFLKILYKIPTIIIFDNKVKKYQKKLLSYFRKIENVCYKKKIYNSEYHYYFKKIKLIKNINKFINTEKKFVLSALNLAFLGSLFSNKVIIYKDLFHWPDGYLPLIISSSYGNAKKIAGRNLIRNMKLSKKIKNIHILGNLEKKQKKYLKKILNKSILYTKLSFGTPNVLANQCKALKKDTLYILTLPTPKQEQVAEILSLKNKNYKIVLLGGAINILTGLEPEVPKKLAYIEFLWRLRFETLKRLKRLIITTLSFIYNYTVEKKYRDILK